MLCDEYGNVWRKVLISSSGLHTLLLTVDAYPVGSLRLIFLNKNDNLFKNGKNKGKITGIIASDALSVALADTSRHGVSCSNIIVLVKYKLQNIDNHKD